MRQYPLSLGRYLSLFLLLFFVLCFGIHFLVVLWESFLESDDKCILKFPHRFSVAEAANMTDHAEFPNPALALACQR
eukprot:m.660705 g.660705  ORF g.660705 m.660705 type:complete len:77 (+) comp22731_c0_seq12:2981-3211(+)